MKKPTIAITMGDPCGIGPEIIAKALREPSVRDLANFVIIGEEKALDPSLDIEVVNPYPIKDEDIKPSKPTYKTAIATISYIEKAVEMALAKEVDAICTAPINKAVLQAHGFSFPGHTEFIKHLTNSDKAVMMLAGPSLKVTLVTIHEPLAKVTSLVTKEKIIETIEVTASSLEEFFGLKNPRVAVCGLNPHGGEGGKFGREEIEIISPAIEHFKNAPNWDISGPYPPDTVFYRASRGEFDSVVAMYHDQGLIPIKLLHFEEAVNITLGIPIIRTSVDHGTAYDIAGKGLAKPKSLIEAIKMACHMAICRKLSSTMQKQTI